LAFSLAALVVGCLASLPAHAASRIGTTFPAGFRVPVDASLGVPVIGFGSAEGPVRHPPVIFLHGNNDTPYPTPCNGSYGAVQAFAQYFLDHGYSPKELWALGYQGDQCDLLTDERRRASAAHTTLANVPDLRAFVRAVLDYTGATQVDIVGHSLGGTLAREWMRQDAAYPTVRRLVAIDAPNHGIINCSPSPLNYYVTLGFTPDSPVCLEYGAANTPFLQRLNRPEEIPGPTRYLTVVNADHSFVYISNQDGVLPPVPAQDRFGHAHDFSRSARLDGAEVVEVRDQGSHDSALRASHTGIVNSPEVWELTRSYLAARDPAGSSASGRSTPADRPVAGAAGGRGAPDTAPGRLAATGGTRPARAAVLLLMLGALVGRTLRRGGPVRPQVRRRARSDGATLIERVAPPGL
jgi:pimeloyl-ACP methyl ester carboxylesterase